jgi:drug/metabolite transporter (DMT)-like permease
MVGFSGTFPATRVAAPVLGGWLVGLGRGIVAALLAAVVLCALREGLPARPLRWRLLGLGLLFGVFWPVAISEAMETVPASRGAIIIGLAPASTALFAVLRAGERPGARQWAAVLLGVAVVALFAASQGGGALSRGDLLLLGSVTVVGLGYAEGALLAREMGAGWKATCWSLVLAAPFEVAVALWAVPEIPRGTLPAWLGFAYVSVVSMFFAYFAWYRGLSRGSIAHTSQIQLLQPVLSVLWAVLLLGEPLSWATVLAGGAVLGIVLWSRR